MGPVSLRVVEVGPEATHELRRRVLRGGRADADVRFPRDDEPGTFHLALTDDSGTVVAVASFYPEPTPWRPRARAVQVRGMAVDASRQRSGAGRTLLEAAYERARAQGFAVLWANGRDSALGFYERLGWQVVGEGFVFNGIPHHVVVRDLS